MKRHEFMERLAERGRDAGDFLHLPARSNSPHVPSGAQATWTTSTPRSRVTS